MQNAYDWPIENHYYDWMKVGEKEEEEKSWRTPLSLFYRKKINNDIAFAFFSFPLSLSLSLCRSLSFSSVGEM